MEICKWCGSKINSMLGEECMGCFGTRVRVEGHPELAIKMLETLFGYKIEKGEVEK
jgi:hypothetical protein